ncbi:MAG: M4 family metallopeptidase, partial [Candidatus Sumerlaeota bacterium]|nr:M4 family metallopeptidase [Candidatus Sumerlaeota bacterium]
MTNPIGKPGRKALCAWRLIAGGIAVWSVAAAALAQLPPKTISASAKREKGITALKTAAQAQAMMGAPTSLAPHETLETDDHFLRGIRFTGAAGLSLAAPSGDAETAARAFLSQYQYLFSSESGAVAFATQRIRNRAEQSFVLLRQTYAGVPVWGGQIAIQTGGGQGALGVRYAFGHLLRDTTALDSGQLAVKPSCDAAQANAAAIALMASQYVSFYLRAGEPELMIYDAPMLGQPGQTRLVWRTTVTSVLGPHPNEFILVDAHTLEIALHYTLTQTVRGREIYDANNTSANPGMLVRKENDPPCSIEDANQAYDYLGDTYDFYNTQHGRDGIDNRGTTISATVRYCDPSSECPFANAFWNGSRIYLGAGMAADDVVAHELTHGVTQNESGLVYAYESGAINESFSDIWGEFVDLTNGKGNDSAAVRWEIGEDLPTSVGVIRDMKDPTRYDQPDRMYSRLWYAGPMDNGGVHINSGVGNKLCYLLTDGGAFNNQTVTGMGIPKVAQLFYECQTHLLTEFSDYEELSFALAQAAINLGLTADEKSNVDRACQAVEIKNPGTLDHYRIIYKDRDNPSLKPELKENKIIISDPRAYGTLSITKIRNAGLYHKISAVQCAGALTKIYTETDIDQIETTGAIRSLTARNAYVKRIAAKEIGTVRISAMPALVSGSAQW